jgi:hypothetical protein
MIEVTDEMVRLGAKAICDSRSSPPHCSCYEGGGCSSKRTRLEEAQLVAAAVAPLIEAQARAATRCGRVLDWQDGFNAAQEIAAEDLAQARAEIERKDRALERLGYAATTALDGQVKLASDLAQARANGDWLRSLVEKYQDVADEARAAAIEEAAKVARSLITVENPDDPYDQAWQGAAEHISELLTALASRPVSEREG